MTAASAATARAAAIFGSCASDHFLNPLVGLRIEIPMTGILQMAPRSLEEMLPQINPDRGGHYGLVHSRTAPNNPLVIAYEEFWQTMKATLWAGSGREGLAKRGGVACAGG